MCFNCTRFDTRCVYVCVCVLWDRPSFALHNVFQIKVELQCFDRDPCFERGEIFEGTLSLSSGEKFSRREHFNRGIVRKKGKIRTRADSIWNIPDYRLDYELKGNRPYRRWLRTCITNRVLYRHFFIIQTLWLPCSLSNYTKYESKRKRNTATEMQSSYC